MNTLDFAKTELVDFVGGHVRGGAAVDVVLVALLAIGERNDGESGAAVRGVVGAHESGEGFVGGDDVSVDGGDDLIGQALLIVSGNTGGKFLGGLGEGIGVDDALALHGNFFKEKAHGHEVVFHAGAKDFSGLRKGAGNLVKASDVVFVMLHGIERHGLGKIGESGVNAVLLIDGHFIFFEVKVGDALLQNANEQVVGELILIGEAGGGDGLQAREEIAVGLIALGNGGE